MKAAFLASGLLHAAVLAGATTGFPSFSAGTPEVRAQIAMVFGNGALADGRRAPVQPAGLPPSADPAVRGEVPPAAAPVLPVSVTQAAPDPEAGRAGDGIAGAEAVDPDAGLVEARADPGNRPPLYPAAAAQRHEHGSVLLRIHVGTDGAVASIDTLRSSGFMDLDEAARDGVRRWRFIPQQQAGAPVASVRDQNFDFVME